MPGYVSRWLSRRRDSPPLRTSASVRTFSVFCRVGFFLASEHVALLLELGGKVESLERDLEMTKAMFGQNAEALAKSLEEWHALEGALDQICNVAQLVVLEVFGSAPSTSVPAIRLAEVLDEVRTLITHGLFYRASGVLTQW